MSAGGEDAKNLNKEGETPADAASEGIPNNTPSDLSSFGLKNVEQTPETSTKADLEDPREVEAQIEKKLPSYEDKAFDVDSELDFVLKWDEDTDLNENQGDNDDKDVDIADKELESDLTSMEKDLDSTEKETESLIEKDTDSLDKEFDSAFSTTEMDLDSLHKTDSNVTSLEKDHVSTDKEIVSIFPSTEKDLDSLHKTNSNITSIEKDLISTDKEICSAFPSTEKDLHSLHKTGSNVTSIEKNLISTDKEICSDFPSTEKDLDSQHKTDSNVTSIEKDLLSTDKEIDNGFTSTEKDLNSLHKTDSNVSFIEENLTSTDKEIDSIFTLTEKNLDNIDQEIETDLLSLEKDLDSLDKDSDNAFVDKNHGNLGTEIETNLVSIEKDLDREDSKTDSAFTAMVNLDKQIEYAASEKDLDIVNKDMQCAVTSLEKDALDEIDGKITVTGFKMDSDNAMDVDDICEEIHTKAASESEDEVLVYSDAEAPDIEDKELMDEIDAEITAEIIKDKLESTETLQISSELLTVQKESAKDKTTEKKASEMDVDDDLTKSVNLLSKADPNNTCSSNTDLETSIYDINKDHGLDIPDVMIDIPTEELIESFDDTEDDLTESYKDKLDQPTNFMNKPVLVEVTTKENTRNLTELQAIEDEIDLEKDISGDINETDAVLEQMLTEEIENAVELSKSAGDTIQTDSMEVNSDNTELNSKVETNNLDQENVSTLEEKVIHADIILEATTQLEAVTSVPEIVPEQTKKVKDIEFSELNLKKPEDTRAACVDETQPSTSNKDIDSTDNAKLKEDTILDSHIDEGPPAIPSIEDKEVESSDVSKLKNANLKSQADEAQHSTSNIEAKVVESSENSKLKDVVDTIESQVDEAKPSTSTKELKDGSSDDTKLKEIETHVADPSTNHSELSDEDQETTDSLGLLAESSRVMDDDDEQEQEAEPDDDDDDDDFDQDDESNLMTAEHSEDSSAQHSEADVLREAMDVDESNDAEEPHDAADIQDMDDAGDENDDEKSNYEKEESNDEKVESNDEKDDSNDEKDESNDERDDFQIQIGEVVSQTLVEAVVAPEESVEAAVETVKAVEAILEDKKESTDESKAAVTVEEKKTVKPTDIDSDSEAGSSKLRQLLLKDSESSAETSEAEKKSPSKTKKLEITKPKNEINIVELEESSSEDDLQVVKKSETPAAPKSPKEEAGTTVETRPDASEVKPAPEKPVKLNTEEVLAPAPAAPVIKPETKASKSSEKASIDFGLEIYSLDSDDEETEVRSKRKSKLTAVELDNARQTNKCINMQCTSDGSVPLVPASMSAAVYFAANQQKGGGLCLYCAKRFEERCEKLIEGVKDITPFLSMDMCIIREEFVEISDSDSEDETEVGKDDEIIGEKGAKFLEEHLADMFNGAWTKFNMEERLLAAQAEINVEVGQLEEECKQIDAMLNECQRETDKLRNDLYTKFADDRREMPAITICDTPTTQWSGLEEAVAVPPVPETREQPTRYQKRRAAAAPAPEPAAKRAAIPLGYAPLDGEPKPAEPKPGPSTEPAAQNDDDNADISVVKLSIEAAPAGLPPPGVATRPPLRPNMFVFAMRNMFGAWHKVRIVEVQPKLVGQFTMCRVRFEQPKTMTKLLPARCLAYEHPPDVRLTIGTRVVALFKDHRVNVDKKEEVEKKEAYYSGIVAEIPNPVNSFRYLIFFDDGYAQYVQHSVTRLVCECAPRVWDEVHPFSRQFVRDYLRAYPERPMVRLHAGQSIKTEWDGKWWVSKVLQVDASLVLVYFDGKKDNKTEWIYRGSTRLAPLYLELQAAERTRARPLPRAQAARRFNMPYVEYTRSDEPADKAPAPAAPAQSPQQTQAQIEQEIRRQRAVAKKSTAAAPAPAPAPPPRDNVTSRVVFYTPKNAIKPHKMVPHTCGPRCKRTDVLALKDLRTYNPLTKPLLSGWERQQVRFRIPATKAVMYRAPCGRRIRDYKELHQYLQATDSDMGVDLFDFNPATHCLAEFLLNKCLISKKDLSHGKENVPVPCVNYYDSSLPEFCSYNTERTPTAGVPLNIDPEFLCGCDCTDDCADKSKCACWKMTLEGARTIGLDTDEVGYVYKRLPEPLPSGIYECNSRCKCKQTCLNRVAQHPLQLKLQVFKTANRGWGIRALNDVPKGAFLCVYAGNLLTDATANLDGLNEGDEYLAELDYIEVVEQMKEGFEEDIPEDAKKLDEEESESSTMSSSDEEQKQDGDDDDFRPAMPTGQFTRSEYSKRLRKREKSKKAKEKEEREKKEREERQKEKDGEDCITISDDEELREPAHFSVKTGMRGKEFVSKYKSVRTLFGKDEACYIMDAKVQGNIGRYLNHSCTPNVFVQNVFVDTHDPRFPWVAFFALSQIRAGTELTWNYNYDVGSVPGKVLYCYCNAPNCRGRLL